LDELIFPFAAIPGAADLIDFTIAAVRKCGGSVSECTQRAAGMAPLASDS
jgi:hypothetical protein